MSRDASGINSAIQEELRARGLQEATAVEIAGWLDDTGILRDSKQRRGLPLRKLLRVGLINGAHQAPNGWWTVRRVLSPAVGIAGPAVAKSDPGVAPGLNWDTRFAEPFREHGFTGFLGLGDVVNDPQKFLSVHSVALRSPGVYGIFAPRPYQRLFLEGPLPNVIAPRSREWLTERWIRDVELVYIGCAGRTLASRTLGKRLRDLINHGSGHISTNGPHKGGERLWQCQGWERFLLAWRATGPFPEPHDVEVAIGTKFQHLTKSLPFANERL